MPHQLTTGPAAGRQDTLPAAVPIRGQSLAQTVIDGHDALTELLDGDTLDDSPLLERIAALHAALEPHAAHYRAHYLLAADELAVRQFARRPDLKETA